MYKTLAGAVLVLVLLAVGHAWAASPPTTSGITASMTTTWSAQSLEAAPFVAATKIAPVKAAMKKAEPQKMIAKMVAPADVGTTLGRTLTQASLATPTTAGTMMITGQAASRGTPSYGAFSIAGAYTYAADIGTAKIVATWAPPTKAGQYIGDHRGAGLAGMS